MNTTIDTTIDSTIDTLPLGRRDRLARAGGTAMSRRKLLGSALVAAGAAGAVATIGTGTAAASAPTIGRSPRGAAPSLSPLMQYLLPSAYRVYDSRSGQAPDGTDPNTGAGDTALARNITRTIDVSYALGAGMNDSGVPTSAEAVLLTVTIANTTGASGYLKIWSDGSPEPSTSVINWDHTGAIVANTVLTGCDGGYIKVKCGGASGASTHFIIDVVSYFEAWMA